jgi:pseudouridine-5'-phosphate glycosidase
MNPYLQFSEEVARARAEKMPLVALETTIISHGMPFPQNLETGLELEEIVKQNGAIPATIALMEGKLKVGLSKEEMKRLASEPDVWKVSIRDMAYILIQKKTGATTVAATMRIAAMAGIRIFATGGIGGVHRGAEINMDISADLTEMAKTSVAIVSAGVKSILDIGLTLEYLETLGVPVVTFGQSAFPSFYSRESGFASPLSMNDKNGLAQMLKTKWDAGLEGSVLIANPIPAEMEIPSSKMEIFIQNALAGAEQHGIQGKEITPYLLKTIAENTKRESLAANMALVKNNTRLAAEIAVLMHSER